MDLLICIAVLLALGLIAETEHRSVDSFGMSVSLLYVTEVTGEY